MENGIRVLSAKGVAIENMTARNYTTNGFFWTGVDGYRGSYLTAYRNGDYGVYAFDSVNGLVEHSYGSGYPCNAVIDDFVSENNGLGYSGTNSGGNLTIINSTFRNNRAGIVPNSGSYELCYPERETQVVGNLIYSNNNGDTPAIDVALLAMGNGIVVPGGVRNTIERNRVWDHTRTGIGLVPFLEEDANDNLPTEADWDIDCAEQKAKPATAPEDIENPLLWNPQQNIVRDNVVSDSRLADLGILVAPGAFYGAASVRSAPTCPTSATAGPTTRPPAPARRTSRRWHRAMATRWARWPPRGGTSTS